MTQIISNSAYKNAFAPLQVNGASYAITKPFTETQKQEVKKEKEKKIDRLGFNIAAVALIAGLGVFGVTRLFSKKSGQTAGKLAAWLGDKASKLAENKHLSGVKTFCFHALQLGKTVLKKSQMIFNVATVKDSLVKFFTPKKIDSMITTLFEKVSIGTSKRAYRKSLASFDSMFARFTEANVRIPDEQAKLIEQKMKSIRETYYQGFSEAARNTRFARAKRGLEGLFEKILNQIKHPGGFLKRAKTGEFIAEEEASRTKQMLQNESMGYKNKIASSDKKGEIDEIMDIYRQHLSPADYQRLQKSVNKSVKSLNKAIDLETDKLFDKVRDLQLGSGTHDTLAFLASLGVIGWGVSRADSKDEKISVTLKYGIPAVIGVMTTILCTVGLIASGPSLLIGLASTIPVNMLGEAVDNMRKKRNEDPKASLLPTLDLKSPIKIIKDIENNNKK